MSCVRRIWWCVATSWSASGDVPCVKLSLGLVLLFIHGARCVRPLCGAACWRERDVCVVLWRECVSVFFTFAGDASALCFQWSSCPGCFYPRVRAGMRSFGLDLFLFLFIFSSFTQLTFYDE